MGEGYVHQGSLFPHVVPRRHERVALAEARLRDLGEIWTHLQHGPEAAVDVVSRHRLPIAGPLDRRRDAAARPAGSTWLRRAIMAARSSLDSSADMRS